MNEIQIFKNAEFGEVRTLTGADGETWFVGKDVADILQYQNGSRDINRHVDEEDKATVAIHDGSQNRNVTVINESGLYSLQHSLNPNRNAENSSRSRQNRTDQRSFLQMPWRVQRLQFLSENSQRFSNRTALIQVRKGFSHGSENMASL